MLKIITISHGTMHIVQEDYNVNSNLYPIDNSYLPAAHDSKNGSNGFIKINLNQINIEILFYRVSRTTGSFEHYNTLII